MALHRVRVAGHASARTQFLILSSASVVLRHFNFQDMRKMCQLLALVFPSTNSVVISDNQRKLKIYLNDPYWVRFAFNGFTYESEVERVLEVALDTHSTFIDCGANIGYWSVFAGAKIGSSERVLAIEATESTFARLSENMEINGRTFSIFRKAIFSQSGMQLQLRTHPRRHGSNTCVFDPTRMGRGYRLEPVESITVDELSATLPLHDGDSSKLVIKLDVEGAEIEALKGAKQSLARGALLIYEDHGGNSNSETTEYILNTLGLEVYFLQKLPLEGIVKIENIRQLVGLKTDPWLAQRVPEPSSSCG